MVTSDQNIVYQQNLAGRKLALVVLGSNIWLIVRNHGATIAAKINAATPGSYDFVEMPLPLKPQKKKAKSVRRRYPRSNHVNSRRTRHRTPNEDPY